MARMTVAQQRDAEYKERFEDDQDSLREWVELWAQTMVDIWRAKIDALSTERDWWVPDAIYDDRTRNHGWNHLRDSLKLQNIIWNDPNAPMAGFTIHHTFQLYGIWVDAGVGKEMGRMVRDDDGHFLGGQKGMKKKGKKWTTTRKAKHWYSLSYWRSCRRLMEEAQDDYTGNFVWLMNDLQKSLSMARMQKMAARGSFIGSVTKK